MASKRVSSDRAESNAWKQRDLARARQVLKAINRLQDGNLVGEIKVVRACVETGVRDTKACCIECVGDEQEQRRRSRELAQLFVIGQIDSPPRQAVSLSEGT
jgi:hypothetical protein